VDDQIETEYLSKAELEHEHLYFGLISRYLESNLERYKMQAMELIKSREIEISFQGTLMNFSIEDRGCAFRISYDGGIEFQFRTWTKLDLRKSLKLKALPMFFAACEADISLESKE